MALVLNDMTNKCFLFLESLYLIGTSKNLQAFTIFFHCWIVNCAWKIVRLLHIQEPSYIKKGQQPFPFQLLFLKGSIHHFYTRIASSKCLPNYFWFLLSMRAIAREEELIDEFTKHIESLLEHWTDKLRRALRATTTILALILLYS